MKKLQSSRKSRSVLEGKMVGWVVQGCIRVGIGTAVTVKGSTKLIDLGLPGTELMGG